MLWLIVTLMAGGSPSIRVGGPTTRSFYSPQNYAFFEFAPASGAGMGTACACATVAGAKGEAMTFSRTSSANCLKASQVSGIVNGDMVTCASGQPRVTTGGTPGLGLLIEGARTNSLLRSEEIDNAIWTKLGSGVAAPTVTADQAVAPTNATTAERVQFAATGAAQYSAIDQAKDFAGAAASLSVFVKGNGSGGTIDLCNSTGTVSCTQCNYTSTDWTRCTFGDRALVVGSDNLIGNLTTFNGGTSRSAADVFIWGAQLEQGNFVSSYVATTSAAVARTAETATLPAAFPSSMPTTGSMASTTVWPFTITGTGETAPLTLSTAGPTYQHISDYRPSVQGWTQYFTVAGSFSFGTGSGMTPLVDTRVSGAWNASNVNSCRFNNGVGGCNDSGAAGVSLSTATLVEIGTYSASAQVFGVVKKVCADPSYSRCR